jgi:predicted TIM-barrel fold metal-dependent hydrolase
VQTHFSHGLALRFRDSEFVRNMGFNLKNDLESYSFKNFVKELYFDSETDMIVLSGVPGRELMRDKEGKVPEGAARGGGILPSWLMSQCKKELNGISGSTRALCQGNLAPNHYWNTATNSMDKTATMEQMEREVKQYGIDSWKWYCHADPGRSGGGFQLDDANAAWFYEQSRKLGMKVFSVHKGYSYQSRTLGHLTNPKDVEKAALQNPDLQFIIYHSAIQHGPSTPAEFNDPSYFNPTTGDFSWHSVLMDVKKRNPKINNVYCEVGSFFNVLAIVHPVMCMHGMGKNIKQYGADHVIWGTDCLWWGSPQWCIDAFKRFQISDELCEKFGYKKITKEDKAKIFGLNAAKVYGFDAKAKRKAFPSDTFERLKTAYLDGGGQRSNAAYGWVRADD